MSLDNSPAIDSIESRDATRDRMPDAGQGCFMAGLTVVWGRLPNDGIGG